jgi:hypothetical protein
MVPTRLCLADHRCAMREPVDATQQNIDLPHCWS